MAAIPAIRSNLLLFKEKSKRIPASIGAVKLVNSRYFHPNRIKSEKTSKPKVLKSSKLRKTQKLKDKSPCLVIKRL